MTRLEKMIREAYPLATKEQIHWMSRNYSAVSTLLNNEIISKETADLLGVGIVGFAKKKFGLIPANPNNHENKK